MKYYTKEFIKYFNITLVATMIILTVIFIKYKPTYSVKLLGEELGYIDNKEMFEEVIKEEIIKEKGKNVDTIKIKEEPEYEFKLVNRNQENNETNLLANIEKNVEVTYKYYEVALDNSVMEKVDTIEEAEELISVAKQETQNEDLNLTIAEKYTSNEEEINTSEIDVAKNEIQDKVIKTLEEEKIKKEENEKRPIINGIDRKSHV